MPPGARWLVMEGPGRIMVSGETSYSVVVSGGTPRSKVVRGDAPAGSWSVVVPSAG
jgi:hypothetical protein